MNEDETLRIVETLPPKGRGMRRFLCRLWERFDRVPYRLYCAKWWLLHRFHPRHRYHVIRTGLKPGWIDRVDLLPVLMVQMLTDFVENETPFNHFDTANSYNAADWVRLRELYEFFKDRSPESLYEIDRHVMTEKLTEIVRLRYLMWT